MRGLIISSLAFILALSSTVAVAAPRAAVSPVPKGPKGPPGGGSPHHGCKTRGACGAKSPPGTCCGTCILIDSAIVSQDACSQQVLTAQHKLFWLTSNLCRVTASLPGPPIASLAVQYFSRWDVRYSIISFHKPFFFFSPLVTRYSSS